jgi:hypothetical protein
MLLLVLDQFPIAAEPVAVDIKFPTVPLLNVSNNRTIGPFAPNAEPEIVIVCPWTTVPETPVTAGAA